MSITTKLGNIVSSIGIVEEKIASAPLDIRTSFKLFKVVKKIREDMGLYEDYRVSLIKKYGEADEDGNISVTIDNLPTFHAEMGELLNTEVALDMEPLDMSSLQDSVKLSPDEVGKIMWLFDETSIL